MCVYKESTHPARFIKQKHKIYRILTKIEKHTKENSMTLWID